MLFKIDSPKIVIEAADVVSDGRLLRQKRLVVENGILRSMENGTTPSNSLVLPTGVDCQVHLRVPGQEEKEDAETGSQAALAGGIAAVLAMPNTNPTLDSPEVIAATKRTLDEASSRWGCSLLLSGAISKGLRSEEPVDFFGCARAGAIAFTDDGVGVMNDEIMRCAFRASADLGIPILQHAEMMGHGGTLAPGKFQRLSGVMPYHHDIEAAMVERDLKILSEFPKARYHVLHVSSARTLDLIRRAKDQGFNVTCEVTPHHLHFCADDIDGENTSFKMNPPLRGQSDREALRMALGEGLIDFVASDHAPHEQRSKTANFQTSSYGTTGLETLLPALLALVNDGKLTIERLVEVFSSAPARLLGIPAPTVNVGKPFQAVVIDDPWKSRTVDIDQMYSKSKNCVFIGKSLPGTVSKIFGSWQGRWFAYENNCEVYRSDRL